KAGQDAWQEITKAESFEAWKKIGAALSIGKAHALRVTGANQAWGQHYSREFCIWMNNHGFSKMLKSTRSHAINMFENINSIERWRAMLSERSGVDCKARSRMSAAGERQPDKQQSRINS